MTAEPNGGRITDEPGGPPGSPNDPPSTPGTEPTDQAYANTDRELWRREAEHESMSYYEPSIFVTEQGNIGINVGGRVYVKPVEEWHRLAREASEPSGQPYRTNRSGITDPGAIPETIFLGRNGAYWRDFTEDGETYYSMCPNSIDNDPVDVVATYQLVTCGVRSVQLEGHAVCREPGGHKGDHVWEIQ